MIPTHTRHYSKFLAQLVCILSVETWSGFLTPRLHIKYSPSNIVTLRTSIGKGYRSPHALAENVSLLASGRQIIIDSDLKQEKAWNMGASLAFNIPLFGKNLELNAEYYYTYFKHRSDERLLWQTYH